MLLLHDKLITRGEKRETSTKTCNETMLRDKLRDLLVQFGAGFALHAIGFYCGILMYGLLMPEGGGGGVLPEILDGSARPALPNLRLIFPTLFLT